MTKYKIKPHIIGERRHHHRDHAFVEEESPKQDLEVVVSQHNLPSSLSMPIITEQHRKVDYLIKPVAHSLSIKETHLQAAQDTLIAAQDQGERFQEFKEEAKQMPLIPQV